MSATAMWSTICAGLVWSVGILLGFGLSLWSRWAQRKAATPVATALSTEQLVEQLRNQQVAFEQALLQVQELQRQQQLLPASVYAHEKQQAEQRAVQLLAQQKQAHKVLASQPTPPPASSAGIQFLHNRPRLQGALWGAGLTCAIGAWAIFLQTESKQQPAPASSSPGSNAMNGEVQALLARLEQAPEDTAALARLNQLLLRQQMFQEAAMVNERLLSIDPNHPQGQVFAAVLQAAKGETAAGRERLRALCEQHPTLPDAWFFRGMLAMQAGEQEEVRLAFQHFVDVAPPGPQRERIAGMLANLKAGAGQPPAAAPVPPAKQAPSEQPGGNGQQK